MIKLEDRPSVIILSIITFIAIFYAFMFLGDNTQVHLWKEQVDQRLTREPCFLWELLALFILVLLLAM